MNDRTRDRYLTKLPFLEGRLMCGYRGGEASSKIFPKFCPNRPFLWPGFSRRLQSIYGRALATPTPRLGAGHTETALQLETWNMKLETSPTSHEQLTNPS